MPKDKEDKWYEEYEKGYKETVGKDVDPQAYMTEQDWRILKQKNKSKYGLPYRMKNILSNEIFKRKISNV